MPSIAIEPSNDEIKNAVRRALDRMIAQDAHLFRVDAGERSLTFRLGHYIQIEFPDWQVDSEYNRNGEIPKALKTARRAAMRRNRDSKSRGRVFPDIILHSRGEHGPNLLAVEAKKASDLTPEKERSDWRKLRAYQNELSYRVTALIVFGTAEGVPVYKAEFDGPPG